LSLGFKGGFFLKIIKWISLGYFGAFRGLYRSMKKFGIVGEIGFTCIGLVWLLWPMVVPYYAENNILYIPAVILSTCLCTFGIKAI
jgi:hypothetical protein